MSTELAIQTPAGILEKVIAEGDLSKLTSNERLIYYQRTCESLGMNPLTRPFEYIKLNDKLTLYARRDATDQLRKQHKVNVTIVARELVESVYIVTARATMPDGRTDESIGAVPLCREDGEWKTTESGKRYFKPSGRFLPLSPEERANAMMKAETKAKRRVTLSIVGLGILDETEIETIQGAKIVTESDLPGNGHKPAATMAQKPPQRPTPAKTVDEQSFPWEENPPAESAPPAKAKLPEHKEPTFGPNRYTHNSLCPKACDARVWQAWCEAVREAGEAKIPIYEFEPIDTAAVRWMGRNVKQRLEVLRNSQLAEAQA